MKGKKHLSKKVVSILLSLVMCTSIIDANVVLSLADQSAEVTEETALTQAEDSQVSAEIPGGGI